MGKWIHQTKRNQTNIEVEEVCGGQIGIGDTTEDQTIPVRAIKKSRCGEVANAGKNDTD